MRRSLKTIGNALFVVGGFFAVFFGVSKISSQGDTHVPLLSTQGFGDIAHADAPYSQSTYYAESSYYSQGGYGGDSGSGGDSGGDSGGCGK